MTTTDAKKPDSTLRVLTAAIEAAAKTEWDEHGQVFTPDPEAFAEFILANLPDGWELAEHVHVWVPGPTYATNPPIQTRLCPRCGAGQEYKPGVWE